MRSKNRISSIYHPTSIALIDDNSSFLANIVRKLSLKDRHIKCLTYTNPIEALEYLKQTKSTKQLLNKSIETDIHSDKYTIASKQYPITINISDLHNFIYNEDIFSQISVVVSDFNMPDMDGVEFCRQLKFINNPVKKIMLTGEADTALATKIFNDGLIDKFILKNNSDMEKELFSYITEMQQCYFQDLTELIVQGLVTNDASCLGDPVFINFFDEIRKELHASSYYLIDHNGSFLFLEDNGSPTWLIVKTEDEINDLVEIMLETDNKTESIINAIKKMEMIPYFKDNDDFLNFMNAKNDNEINKYLRNANILVGKKKYCYFLTKELINFELDKEKIVSFDQHIRNSQVQIA